MANHDLCIYSEPNEEVLDLTENVKKLFQQSLINTQDAVSKKLLQSEQEQNPERLRDKFGDFLKYILNGVDSYKCFIHISRALDKVGLLNDLIQNHVTYILEAANSHIQLWLKDANSFSQDDLKIIIRVILQLIQSRSQKPNNGNNLDVALLSLLQSELLKVITTQISGVESILLAGTCVIHIMNVRMTVELVVDTYIKLTHNNSCLDSSTQHAMLDDNQLQALNMSLINGLLNSNLWDLVLYIVEDNVMLLRVHSAICNLFENKMQIFQAFRILLCWLRTFQKLYKQLSNRSLSSSFGLLQNNDILARIYAGRAKNFNDEQDVKASHMNPIFCHTSEIFLSICNIISVNWENFTQGVSTLVSECFTTLLALHKQECGLLGYEDDTIVRLMTSEMEVLWTTKSKYPAIAVLLEHYELQKLLQEYPDFPMKLTTSLSSNPLASAGADVYRKILQLISNNGESDPVELWFSTWWESVDQILSNDDELAQQNLLQYWLPSTLKIIPSSIHCLLQMLMHRKAFSVRYAAVIVMKTARAYGLLTFTQMFHYEQMEFLKECLYDTEERIRIEAFATVCLSNKKAESLSAEEMQCVEQFLAYNLNVDSAPFRQQLVTNLKLLLVRVRDSSTNCLNSKAADVARSNGQLNDWLRFVDNLYKLVLKNLFPGASYQRRRTCLDIMLAILQVFKAEPDVNKRKGKVPIKTPALVMYAQDQGLWKFTSLHVFESLVCCIQDFMSEIKGLAVRILDQYFDWNDASVVRNRKYLEERASRWLCSPKPYICESGALLYSLILKKFIVKQKNSAELKLFFEFLLTSMKQQFEAVKTNILKASEISPIHGVILTLKFCLPEIHLFEATVLQQLKEPISEIISLSKVIIDHFMNFLSHKHTSISDAAPSFADMGEAIDDIIKESETNMNYDNPCDSAMSMEFQLILSCCWINLRECCYLLAKISKLAVKLDQERKEKLLTVSEIEQAGNLIVNVLLKCRHKGVIEACCLALGEYCQILLCSGMSDYQNIPFDLLKDALVCIETSSQSSTTRRSAGLPLLICAILTHEPIYHYHPLLNYTVETLLRLVALPLPSEHAETSDLPQVHALHILKALVHDAHFAQSMQPYVGLLVELCIQNFDSLSWAVRNACLQLFGSLISRLLGQKKVRDDYSLHNNITAESFFHQHANLKSSLLKVLEDGVANKNCCRPGLIPVLSVLGRLAPSCQNDETSSTLRMFSNSLFSLLDHSSVTVRKLAADGIVALTSYVPTSLLMKLRLPCHLSTNALHGHLLVVKRLCTNLDRHVSTNEKELVSAIRCCDWLAVHKSYIIRALFLNCIQNLSSEVQSAWFKGYCNKSDDELVDFQNDVWLPGKSEWIRRVTEISLSMDNSLHCVETCLESKNEDRIHGCFNVIHRNVECRNVDVTNLCHDSQFQKLVIDFTVTCSHSAQISSALDLVIKVLENCTRMHNIHSVLTEQETVLYFQSLMEGARGVSSAASAIVVLGYIINTLLSQEVTPSEDVYKLLNAWMKSVRKYSEPLYTEDLRIRLAEALCVTNPLLIDVLCQNADCRSRTLLTLLLETMVNLLTDENSDVRHKATKFTSLLPRADLPYHQFSNISTNYGLLIFVSYLTSKLNVDSVFELLWPKIDDKIQLEMLQTNTRDKHVVLFDQEDVNIYAEERILGSVYTDHLLMVVRDADTFPDSISKLYEQQVSALIDLFTPLLEYLKVEMATYGMWCLSNFMQNKMYLFLYKYCCRVRVMAELGGKLGVDGEIQNELKHILFALHESETFLDDFNNTTMILMLTAK